MTVRLWRERLLSQGHKHRPEYVAVFQLVYFHMKTHGGGNIYWLERKKKKRQEKSFRPYLLSYYELYVKEGYRSIQQFGLMILMWQDCY